jgi:hypothetical protein
LETLFDVIDQMEQKAHAAEKPSWRRDEIFADDGRDGQQRKEEGMAKVLRSSQSMIYREHLRDALFCFQVGDEFTIEALTSIVGRPPAACHYNLVGACVNGMAKARLIEKTGRTVPAQRASLHGSDLPIWRLVKYPERSSRTDRVTDQETQYILAEIALMNAEALIETKHLIDLRWQTLAQEVGGPIRFAG